MVIVMMKKMKMEMEMMTIMMKGNGDGDDNERKWMDAMFCIVPQYLEMKQISQGVCLFEVFVFPCVVPSV